MGWDVFGGVVVWGELRQRGEMELEWFNVDVVVQTVFDGVEVDWCRTEVYMEVCEGEFLG